MTIKVFIWPLLDNYSLYLFLCFQGIRAWGIQFASTEAILFQNKPPGYWLPATAPLCSLAPQHHILASQAMRPTATKTYTASPCTNTRVWNSKETKWHCSCFPAWGLHCSPWRLEVWLLPWKRGNCHPRPVWGKELLLRFCILKLLISHSPTRKKWCPLVFLSIRLSFLFTCVNEWHVPGKER